MQTMFQRSLFSEEEIYTVSSLTKEISLAVQEALPEKIKLKGEVSNLKKHSSGHIYFTLKDVSASINAIIWRSQSSLLLFDIKNGDELLVKGHLDFYPPSGRYQIICDTVSQLGIGALQEEYKELIAKLSAEGIFHSNYKKPLPAYPEKIGIVTSKTGAVIQDICSVFHRRYPSGELILYPAKVQGEGASENIKRGIEYFNNPLNPKHVVDVIIIARGGGTLEDLWAFNTETVAYAIFKSNIPVISAVGHEVDFSISDYVADARAGTPSIAAELVSIDTSTVQNFIKQTLELCRINAEETIHRTQSELSSILNSRGFIAPQRKLDLFRQEHERFIDTINFSCISKIEKTKILYDQLLKRINVLSCSSTQRRGYALIQRNNKFITKSTSLNKGDSVSIQFSDGTKQSVIS